MKTFTSILLLAGCVTAQSIGESVPACAAPCLSDAISSATSCSQTDAACQCTVDNYRAIYTAALTCVLEGCGADTAIAQVLPAAEAFCLDAVGPISAPPVDDSAPATTAPSTVTSTPTVSPTGAASGSAGSSVVSASAASPTGAAETSAPAGSANGAASNMVASWLTIAMAVIFAMGM